MIIPQLKKWDAHVSTEWKYPRIFRNRCFGPSVLAATVWQKGTLATICFYSCTSSGVHSSTEVLDEQKQFHPMNIALHATLQLTIQKGSQWLAAARSLLYRERAAKPNSVKSHATACYSRVPVLAFFCWGYHFWEETAGSTETANSRLTDPYCRCSCPASALKCSSGPLLKNSVLHQQHCTGHHDWVRLGRRRLSARARDKVSGRHGLQSACWIFCQCCQIATVSNWMTHFYKRKQKGLSHSLCCF